MGRKGSVRRVESSCLKRKIEKKQKGGNSPAHSYNYGNIYMCDNNSSSVGGNYAKMESLRERRDKLEWTKKCD